MKNSKISFEFGTALKLFLLSTILIFNACEDPGYTSEGLVQQNEVEDIMAENVNALIDLLGQSVKTAIQTPNLFVDLKPDEVLVRSSDCAEVSLGDEVDYPKKAWVSFDECPNNQYDGVIDITCYVPLGEINENGPEFSLATQTLSVNGNSMKTDGEIEFSFLSMDGNSICYTYELSGGVTTFTANGISETYFPAGMTGCMCIKLEDGATPTSLTDFISSLENIQLKIDAVEVCCSNDQGETIMCSCIDTNDGFITSSIECGCPYAGIVNIYDATNGENIGQHEEDGVVGNDGNGKEDSNDPEVCDCEGKDLEQICHLQGQGQGNVYINLVLPCAAAKAHLKNHEGDYCGPCNPPTKVCDGEVTTSIDYGVAEDGSNDEQCDEYVSIGGDILKLGSCKTH